MKRSRNHLIVTSTEQMESLGRGKIVLSGQLVSATLDAVDMPGWRQQPVRRANRADWRPGEDVVYLHVNEEAIDSLKRYRFRDIVLAYDGYLRWILEQKEDLVFIAMAHDPIGTWVTAIAYEGEVITSIKERRLPSHDAPLFTSECEDFINALHERYTRTPIVVSQTDIPLPPSMAGLRQIGDAPLKKAKNEIDMGVFRVPVSLAAYPVALLLAAIIYTAVSFIGAFQGVSERVEEFNTALTGIEDEYRKGAEHLRLLEAQRVLLTEMGSGNPLSDKLRSALSALAASENLLLIKLDLQEEDTRYALSLRFAVLPDRALSPVEQLAPIVERLAGALGTSVDLDKSPTSERFRAISTRQEFRTYEVSTYLPREEVVL